MQTLSAGIRSVSVALPEHVRTNDYYREHYPKAVASAEASSLARIWSPGEGPAGLFEQAMQPYVEDPFRGAVARRVLGPDESALTLQRRASKAALSALGMTARDVDLLISCAFFPDQIDVGNASFLARDLDLGGTAWNLESACSSALVALDTAAALVATGRHRNVLVAVACTYSSVSDEADTLSWFLGDGGGAFVVGRVDSNEGVIATHAIHTAETCGAFYQEVEAGPDGRVRRKMLAGKNTGKTLRDTAEPYVRRCCEEALRSASVSARDIRLFVFNTPTAWYADFCARALGVDPKRTMSHYPSYANIGPALVPVNLHHAVRDGRLTKGDLVLVYSVGSASSAAATVMRWGDVAIADG